eukprot:TRINITY_DN65831_c7_g2_i2.p1 TRINITY_DN65831_c7_g2~~TRINITY_DN65831_c7_g2_i2.p1  ORF type:complete len:845 (+),score=440.87 TRINITY_DN65831_c7_g2_i2:341-2536(+)
MQHRLDATRSQDIPDSEDGWSQEDEVSRRLRELDQEMTMLKAARRTLDRSREQRRRPRSAAAPSAAVVSKSRRKSKRANRAADRKAAASLAKSVSSTTMTLTQQLDPDTAKSFQEQTEHLQRQFQHVLRISRGEAAAGAGGGVAASADMGDTTSAFYRNLVRLRQKHAEVLSATEKLYYQRKVGGDSPSQQPQQQQQQQQETTTKPDNDDGDIGLDETEEFKVQPARSESPTNVGKPQYAAAAATKKDELMNELAESTNASPAKSKSKKRRSQWKPRTTIPQTFSFAKDASATMTSTGGSVGDSSASPTKKSLTKEKFEQYLAELKRREEEPLQFTFRANPVPPSTLLPKYEKLMKQQEERRRQVREKSKEITKKNERPFSFYERDQQALRNRRARLEARENEAQIMREQLLQQIRQEEEELQRRYAHIADREERVKKLAADKLKKSQLPKRMAESQRKDKSENDSNAGNQDKKKDGQQGGSEKEQEEVIFRANKVPDFRALQRKFADQLAKRKEAAAAKLKKTKHREFRLGSLPSHKERQEARAAERAAEEAKQREEEERARTAKYKKGKKKKKKKPLYKRNNAPAHGTTAKWERLLEFKKQQKRKEEQELMRKEQEERERQARMQKMRVRLGPHLRSIKQDIRESQERQIKQRRRAMREQAKRYAAARDAMMAKVASRPLLIEFDQREKERVAQRRKALLAIKASLDEAGISDYQRYFNQEELDDLNLD